MGSQYRENLKRQYGREQAAEQPADTLAVRDLIGESPIVVTATSSGIVISGGMTISGSGVVGPGSSTDNALPRWDGAAGNLVKDSNILVDDSGNITGGTWQGNAIGETFGGTNQTSYTQGDILYASATDVLSKLGVGTNGQVLTLSSGLPSWSSLPSATGLVGVAPTTDNALTRWSGTTAQAVKDSPATLNDSGDIAGLQEVDLRTVRASLGVEGGSISGVWAGNTITEGFGGTNQTTYSQGDILYASAADTLSKLAAGSDGQFLSLSAGTPMWSAVPSGGAGSGITGPVSSTDNAITRWDGTTGQMVQNSVVTIDDIGQMFGGTWQGAVVGGVYGGTGQTIYASGDILYADTTFSLAKLPVGAENEVLTVVEGGLNWKPAATGGASVLDGDASGPASSTTVSGLQNRHVNDATPTVGQTLTWDGSQWLPQTPSAAGSGIGGDFHIILGASGSPATIVDRLNNPDTVLPPGWSGLDGTGSGPGSFTIDSQLTGGTADDVVFEHPAGFSVKVQLLLETPSGIGAGIQWQPDHTFSTWFKSNTGRTQTRITDLLGKTTTTDIVHIFVQLIT